MDEYIIISSLNDFIFCPYSIYLHNVYMDADEDMYHATPQIRGKNAHEPTDNKSSSTRSDVILALPVYSEKYHLMGKIDVYKVKEKKLIERKYQQKSIFQYSVYEVNNTSRILDNLILKIENEFAKEFDGGDSVIIFDVSGVKLKKYGNAIHRDKDIVYF